MMAENNVGNEKKKGPKKLGFNLKLEVNIS
jgi:hypothetical protein